MMSEEKIKSIMHINNIIIAQHYRKLRFARSVKNLISANRIGRKLGYDPYYVCIENRLARTKQVWVHAHNLFCF